MATIGVVTAYIFAGAGIFAITEEWSVLDGAYFCFITFTTIGFGDFVPGKNTLTTEKRGMAALCTLYLLVGMVIMAMCFKLMQDEGKLNRIFTKTCLLIIQFLSSSCIQGQMVWIEIGYYRQIN